MKKIISMISAVAIAAASFTSMAFAASVPTMKVTADKITDFSGAYAGYAEYANDYGLDVYSVKFTGTGIALSTSTSGMAKKITGNSVIGATIKFTFACDAALDEGWVFEKFASITPPSTNLVVEDTYTCAMAGTSPLYPPAKTAQTVSADDETAVLEEIVFAIDPSNPVTLTFQECAINVGTFANDSPTGSTTYKMGGANALVMSDPTFVLPVEEKYTYTFKAANGTDDIAVLSNLAAGATVTAPTATAIAGKVFDHWSDEKDGAAVTVDTTASGNKTYYAVYVDEGPTYDVIEADTTEQAPKVAESGASYTGYSGDLVPLTKNYAIARFITAINSAKKYQLHATSAEGTKDFDVNFGLIEAAGTANFVAIIKGAPKDTVMELRASDK